MTEQFTPLALAIGHLAVNTTIATDLDTKPKVIASPWGPADTVRVLEVGYWYGRASEGLTPVIAQWHGFRHQQV